MVKQLLMENENVVIKKQEVKTISCFFDASFFEIIPFPSLLLKKFRFHLLIERQNLHFSWI